jgi:acyl CoA:acetate/3-ketoacid CoA transferase beta subunit
VSTADVVTCALAREVRDGDVVGVGLGTPLALCAALVAQRTHAPNATVLAGGASSPQATLKQITHHEVDGRTPGFVPHLDTMEMAERQAMTLQFLRPAEVGADGSANTSRLVANGKLVRFPGGLALADVVNLMPRIVLYHTAHERRALPAQIGFRTSAGGGIERGGYTALGPTKVITDRCVIDFAADGPRLASIHPGEDVAGVVAETGFALEVGAVVETAVPSEAELAALEEVDPDRLRELELRKRRAAATGSTATERSTNA